MIYKRLGRTNLKVSVIGFGGGPLQVLDNEEAVSLITYGMKKGINIIDVDKVHKDNENKVGDALLSNRSKMFIMAKSFAQTKIEMNKAIKESLDKLKTNYIDIYQMHLVMDKKDLHKRLNGALVSLKKANKNGIIRFTGISGHHIPTLIEAIRTNEFDTALIPYNIGHTMAKDKLFDTAKSNNVGIISMKPLGGGMLIDPKFYGEEPFEKAKYMNAENALKFVLSNKKIACVLVGFNKKEHIDEAVKVGNKEVKITKKELSFMNKRVHNFLGDDYCRNCKYCLPCEGTNGQLEIDNVLKLYTYRVKYGYKIRPKIEYSELKVKADSCINCGKCVSKCPYNIPIPKRLKEAHKLLSITDSDLKEWAKGEMKNYNLDEIKRKFIEYYTLLFKNKAEIKECKDGIIQIKKELQDKDREIRNKNKMIAERDDDLKNKQKDLKKLDERAKRKERELRKIESDLRNREEELREINEKLNLKEKELYNIYNSKMYKYFVSNVWKVQRKVKRLLNK